MARKKNPTPAEAKKTEAAKAVPKLKAKYSGLMWKGRIWRNPLSEKEAEQLKKHPLAERLFE